MPNYAVIVQNRVVDALTADSKEDAELLTKAECREINDSFPYGPGFYFNGSEWTQAIIEEVGTEEGSTNA
jgi:hypothetical protein